MVVPWLTAEGLGLNDDEPRSPTIAMVVPAVVPPPPPVGVGAVGVE
jgi:hypothetical protein